MTSNDLGRMVLATARQHPDLLAIVTDSSMVTYTQFARLVGAYVARMQALGIGPGSHVVSDSGDVGVVAPVILGCALLGASWVSAGAARHLPKRLAPTHWLVDTATSATDGRVLVTSAWATTAPADLDALAPVSGTDPFIYAPTSGTTGNPKILVLSQDQQARRALATKADFLPRQTVFCTLFRADAYPYITRFLSAFVNGATVVQSRDPALWQAAGVNHVYGSVAQVGAFLEGRVLPRKLPLLHISGAKLPDSLALHLLQSFEEVVDLYASTETNRSFKNQKYLDETGQLATRGQPLDSKLEIVSETGEVMAQGSTGLVRVTNSYLADAYLDNPAATAASFRDGAFYTGDLGFIGPRGELQILGRSGDILNLGGIKVNAAEMDQALRALPGVADAMSFDLPVQGKANAYLAFIVPAPGAAMADIAAAFRSTIQPRFGTDRAPARLIEISAVPRAHDGGAQRFLCQSLYQSLHQARKEG